MAKKNIVVIGSSNTDMTIKVAKIPRPGETVIGGEFSMAAGGKGANQAVAAARAGGTVSLVARVGNDVFGTQAVQGFIIDEINVDHVSKDKTAPSGVALIFVGGDGENSIAVASGANARLSPADVEAARDVIAAADILVMPLEIPIATVEAAAQIAAAHGVRVILNPAPAQPLSGELLKNTSVLTPNESEAEFLTGVTLAGEADMAAAARVILAKGVKTVLITLGARGAFVATAAFHEIVPGFRGAAVDTTAAGDVFNGALAVALAEARPLRDAVRFANAAAALSVTKLGAQPSAPRRADIDALIGGGASG